MKMSTRSRISTGELIVALRRTQSDQSYLPKSALRQIGDELGIPMSRIYAVVTFYDEFSLERRGRHNVCVCRGSACGVKGGKDVIAAAGDVLGIDAGETTEDYKYTLDTVSCFGNCAVAPAMLVDKDLYGDLTPERVKSILGGGEDGSSAGDKGD